MQAVIVEQAADQRETTERPEVDAAFPVARDHVAESIHVEGRLDNASHRQHQITAAGKRAILVDHAVELQHRETGDFHQRGCRQRFVPVFDGQLEQVEAYSAAGIDRRLDPFADGSADIETEIHRYRCFRQHRVVRTVIQVGFEIEQQQEQAGLDLALDFETGAEFGYSLGAERAIDADLS